MITRREPAQVYDSLELDEQWHKALAKATQEATNDSEIQTRAMVYYREIQRLDAASSGSIQEGK